MTLNKVTVESSHVDLYGYKLYSKSAAAYVLTFGQEEMRAAAEAMYLTCVAGDHVAGASPVRRLVRDTGCAISTFSNKHGAMVSMDATGGLHNIFFHSVVGLCSLRNILTDIGGAWAHTSNPRIEKALMHIGFTKYPHSIDGVDGFLVKGSISTPLNICLSIDAIAESFAKHGWSHWILCKEGVDATNISTNVP